MTSRPNATASPAFPTNADRIRGVVAILIAATIWGTLPLVLRQIDGASLIKVFYRVGIAMVAMTAYLAVTGKLRGALCVDRRTVRSMLVQGVILGVNWSLFLGAFELANVATVELLMYMGPVIVAIIAPSMLGEPFDRRIVIPLALSLAGLLTMLIPQGISISAGESLGATMAFASSFTYAIMMVRNKRFVTHAPGSVVVWYGYIGAIAFLLPLAAWQYAVGNGPTGGFADFGWFAILGVAQTAFASLLFFYGLRRLRADQSSVLTYMEPVSAVVLAALVLGEPLTAAIATGGLLVVVGGTMVVRLQAQRGIEVVSIEAGASGDESIELTACNPPSDQQTEGSAS